MDVNSFTQIVSLIGFPAVMCLVFAWLLYREQNIHREENQKTNELINANTLALTELRGAIDELRHSVKPD